MGADFYKIKPEHDEKEYPWPCKRQPNRTIQLFDDDILTKQKDGKGFTKHTGLCCLNIQIPETDLDAYEGWPKLQINGLPYFKHRPVRKLT